MIHIFPRIVPFFLLFLSVSLVSGASSPLDTSRTSINNFVVGDSSAQAGGINKNKSGLPAQRMENFKIIRRSIDYKEQITLSVAMMALIALIITTTQAWNPN
ncbi:MAG: hypothetical protein PHC61_00120 [Chitinivibrionales bacterium]|nr:hypothetical protein [Chitinivibrionales bacterium]